jgi:hypothetical protein
MEEFGSSLEVANLGLSLYVLGLGLGPLLFSPLSEVWEPIHSMLVYILTLLVLWKATNLPHLDNLLSDLVDSMCRSAKHGDTYRCAILEWVIRKCISGCREWHCC